MTNYGSCESHADIHAFGDACIGWRGNDKIQLPEDIYFLIMSAARCMEINDHTMSGKPTEDAGRLLEFLDEECEY